MHIYDGIYNDPGLLSHLKIIALWPLKTAYGDLKWLLYHQAYYGPRVNIPPYFNSAVAAGHAPHPYMWGPPQVVSQTSI